MDRGWRIREFDWDEENLRHIARHGVEPEEAEEVFLFRTYKRKTGSHRYLVLGRTGAGRRLMVVLERLPGAVARVVTARDMDGKERGLYDRRSK